MTRRREFHWLVTACVGVFAALLAPLGAVGAPPEDQKSPAPNAALRYWSYYKQGLDSGAFNTNWTFVDDSDRAPHGAESKQLEEIQAVVEGLIRASALEECDWGVEYELGLFAEYPYFGPLRMFTRVLRADSRRLADLGKSSEAFDRIEAVFNLSRHGSGPDDYIIATLLRSAIAGSALNEAERLVTRGVLIESEKQRLRDQLRRFDADDPIGFATAITVSKRNTAKDLGLELEDRARKDGSTSPELTQAHSAVARDIAAQIAPAFDGIVEAWSRADAMDRIAQIERRANAGEFGPGNILLPAASKAKQSELNLLNGVRRIRDLLGPGVPDSPSQAPQDSRNPAAGKAPG